MIFFDKIGPKFNEFMEFGGQILSYHKFKGAVFAAQKVDKALYLEIDLKVATQK